MPTTATTTPPSETSSSTASKKRKQPPRVNHGSGGFFFAVICLFGLLSCAMHSQVVLPQDYNQRVTELEVFVRDSMNTLSKQGSDFVSSSYNSITGAGDAPAESLLAEGEDEFVESTLAGLYCEQYGGPNDEEAAREMVYWQDIPDDRLHVSPFKRPNEKQYLTFEPDQGGWNNIRMSLETVIALAFAMGRTLVLPPLQQMYLLGEQTKTKNGTMQRHQWTFAHFFQTADVAREHYAGLEIISTEEFLQRHVQQGKFTSRKHVNEGAAAEERGEGQLFAPNNQTNFDNKGRQVLVWLRTHARNIVWERGKCLAAFPASTDPADVETLQQINAELQKEGPTRLEDYLDKPRPVNASTRERLREMRGRRPNLCIYDQELQQEPVLHIAAGHLGRGLDPKTRLLIHFYAYLFFQDWRHDLWMKRFVRDHIRYTDEIQCAAARVVAAVRDRARKYNPQNSDGIFDTMHVRRGDFQYKNTRIDAEVILERTKLQFTPNTTVFIATDERDKNFFKPLADYYHVLFLSDFKTELGDVNTNFYGMLDVLVASKGHKFFGCWFSTFTAYINRLRGYHADMSRDPDHERGIIKSWYYVTDERYNVMRQYTPVTGPFWSREYPAAWRLLNTGMQDYHAALRQARAAQRRRRPLTNVTTTRRG